MKIFWNISRNIKIRPFSILFYLSISPISPMLSQTIKIMVCRVFRSIHTSSRVCANHYDALGITPKATQSDIKSAYYKLSKVYHPDKSDDEESAKKFRAISEAYEVLGNIQLKKMYDKGLLGHEKTTRVDYKPEPEPTDPSLKFYRSRQHRHMAPTMDGRVPIYNFDAWSKNHYGDLLKKSQYNREFLRKQRAKEADALQTTRQEAIMYMMFVIGGLFLFLVISGTADYDKDQTKHRKKNSSS